MGDGLTGHLFDGRDDFEDGGGFAGAEIVEERSAGSREFIEHGDVGAAEIVDMHIVAQAGAIGRFVIVAEDLERLAQALGGIDGERDQVRLGIVVFSDLAIFGCTGGVEVAESRKAEPVGVSERLQRVFNIELGLPVRVDRSLGRRFDDRHLGGFAVGRAGRGEHEFLHIRSLHAAQEMQRRGDVVEIVFERISDAFAHVGVGREMHHELDLLFAEDLTDFLFVAEIGRVELYVLRNGLPMPIDKVVDHDWLVAGSDQLTDTVTADVTGTSNNKNVHFQSDVLLSSPQWLAISLLIVMKRTRIVITGVGLTAPNGNSLQEFRQNLLDGKAGIQNMEIRYMGMQHAGICDYDALRYQKKKEVRVGTRAGSIAIYCANEALADSGIDFEAAEKDRVGIYIGCTEHGNVETENEIYNISKFDYDTKYWSHYHNPRTVANNPAGETSLNLGITGPAYTIGAACAAGNMGLIHASQMLRLGEVDVAICGGISESIRTFGIYAGFKSQNALATHEDPNKASRPFDVDRNGIVISEGGALYTLERLEDAQARGAKIYGEIGGYHVNSDASDYVLPNPTRQAQCVRKALKNAELEAKDIHIVNTHATATPLGDIQECEAIRAVFGEGCPDTSINNTKSYIGHCMGAAGALELAGNLPSFEDLTVHPTINVDNLDPKCDLPGLVLNQPRKVAKVDTILNNSFGMLGINSTLIVRRFVP
jgi:3-oxoacyl-[acyl-carrier-protein] synthase II